MNPYYARQVAVSVQAKSSFIARINLLTLAERLAGSELLAPAWREENFPKRLDIFLEFLGILNALNFCFFDIRTGAKYDVTYKEKVWRGSAAMAAALMRALDSGAPIFNEKYLRSISEKDAQQIFAHVSVPLPLMESRMHNLRNVGVLLKHEGSFRRIFESAGYRLYNNGRGIVEVLASYACYNDIRLRNNAQIPFMKRAQLLPLMYEGRARDSGALYPQIRDLENFGGISDYAVPNALRLAGVLVYEPSLAARIDQGAEIPAYSTEEIEIRAQTCVAVTELLYLVNSIRRSCNKKEISMVELDYAVWQMGRKISTLHHRTHTAAY